MMTRKDILNVIGDDNYGFFNLVILRKGTKEIKDLWYNNSSYTNKQAMHLIKFVRANVK